MNTMSNRLAAALVVATSLLVGRPSSQTSTDWPQWRGPNRDGISQETGLLQKWPAAGPPLAWKGTGAGIGFSSFAIAAGRLYTQGGRGQSEYVLAYDAASGKRLWESPLGAFYSNYQGDGARGTPTVDGSRLYALGASGDLACIDAQDGRAVWKRSLTKEFGGRIPSWGYSESPLIVGERLLVSPGGREAAIVALNKKDGATLWKSQNDAAAYSSAVVHKIGSVQQAIYFTDERVLGVDISNGQLLWSYAPVANDTANIATPIVRGNQVFVSSDYGTGAALLNLQAVAGGRVEATEVYFSREMRNHHSSSVLVGDYLYGFSSSVLTSLRFDDGKLVWRDRSVGKGSLVYADNRLYLFSENGVVGLAEASSAGYREHGRFSLSVSGAPTWSHPVVSGGRLYLRDQDSLYAYNIRQ
jgi:outer membrane protein assembly factor BamB